MKVFVADGKGLVGGAGALAEQGGAEAGIDGQITDVFAGGDAFGADIAAAAGAAAALLLAAGGGELLPPFTQVDVGGADEFVGVKDALFCFFLSRVKIGVPLAKLPGMP